MTGDPVGTVSLRIKLRQAELQPDIPDQRLKQGNDLRRIGVSLLIVFVHDPDCIHNLLP